jgi:hypothetical protein
MAVTLPESIETLLANGIDYAGLFPPASLPMAAAVANYRAYRLSPDAWALGRLIVPAARVEELMGQLEKSDVEWSLSVTLSDDRARDRAQIDAARPRARAAGVTLDAFEARVATAAAVADLAGWSGPAIWYGEVELGASLEPMLDAVLARGGRAKIRMGGVTEAAFPEPRAVARFLLATAARRLPFKATAGLHHPLRGRYPLQYGPEAPIGTMFGYLNLLVAVDLAGRGASLGDLVAVLDDPTPGAIAADDTGLLWRGHRVDRAAAAALRRRFDGFGSCSFTEPMDELLPAIGR